MQEIYFKSDQKDFMNLAKKNKTKIVAFITIGIAIIFAFLLYKYIAPFGKSVSYKFTLPLPGAEEITEFSPKKDSILKIPSQIITTSQSRLSLTLLSKDIQSIQATLKYKKGPKEVMLGVRGDEKDSFISKPFYHSWLQDLDWKKIEENGFILWQRDKGYSSISEFVNHPPLGSEVASYYADSDRLSLLQSVQSEKQGNVVIDTPLRGNHTMLVQVTHAPLTIQVSKQDLNNYVGEDTLKITIAKGSATVAEATIPDDGITDAGGLKLQPQEKTITADKIDPGTYKVNFSCSGGNADSLITRISVNQQKAVFENTVFILANKPTTVFTNAKTILLKTFHDTGLQTVKLDDTESLVIDKSLKEYTFDLKTLAGKDKKSSLYKLVSPKNDLIFKGDGYFAFSEDAFFNPNVISSVDVNTLNNWNGINYVLTTWQKAKKDGDWLISSVSFDPKMLHIVGDKLYFSLEMPDFAKSGGELEIDSLDIEVKSGGVLSNAGKGKTETKPAAEKKGKQNIFTRAFGWVGQKAAVVKKAVGGAFGSARKAVRGFFNELIGMIRGQKAALSNPITVFFVGTPTPQPKADQPLAGTPSATPNPTKSPSAATIGLLIRVLNGGADKGAAGSVAAMLKDNGFTNVKADNADRTDYIGATIRYREGDLTIAAKLESLLKKEFGLVQKTPVATSTPEAVIILGKK